MSDDYSEVFKAGSAQTDCCVKGLNKDKGLLMNRQLLVMKGGSKSQAEFVG